MLFKRISFYLALLGILGVIFLVKQLRARPPAPPPLVEPARSPFTSSNSCRVRVGSVMPWGC